MVMFTFSSQISEVFILFDFFFHLIFNVFNSFLIGKIEWFEREWLTQIQNNMNNLYHIQTVDYFFVRVVN